MGKHGMEVGKIGRMGVNTVQRWENRTYGGKHSTEVGKIGRMGVNTVQRWEK